MKDYDLIIIYHPGKTNVVANAVSRRYFSNATAMIISHGPIVEDIMRLKLQVLLQGNNVFNEHGGLAYSVRTNQSSTRKRWKMVLRCTSE